MSDTSAAASGAAATTTTTSPAASQPAASSPATTPATSTAPTPQTPATAEAAPPRTADQILDANFAAAAANPDTGAEPDADATPKESEANTEPEIETKPEGDETQDEAQAEEVPEHYKGVFAKHPELRMAFFRDRAFRDLKLNVKTAREMVQAYPTVQDFREGTQDANALRTITRDYESNPETILPILESNPASFAKLTSAITQKAFSDPGALYKANPEAFRPVIDYAASTIIGNLRAAAQDGDAEAGAIADMLDERLGQPEARQPEKKQAIPEQQELEALRAERNSAKREQLKALFTTVKDGSEKALLERLEQEIGKRDPNGLMSKGARAKAAKDALTALQVKVRGNEQYRTGLPGALNTGKAQDAISYVLKYAETYLSGIVGTTVAEWRNEVLSANKQTLERLDKIAPAPPAATPASPAPPRDQYMSHKERQEAVFARHGL